MCCKQMTIIEQYEFNNAQKCFIHFQPRILQDNMREVAMHTIF